MFQKCSQLLGAVNCSEKVWLWPKSNLFYKNHQKTTKKDAFKTGQSE